MFCLTLPVIETKFLNKIFKATPSSALLLLANAPFYTVADANTAYLTATGTKEADLVGKSVFEIFPYSIDSISFDAAVNLRRSLSAVISTGRPDIMATQKCRVSAICGERATDSYWNIENIPVLDEDENIGIIIHSVNDITRLIREKERQKSEEQILIIRDQEEEIRKRDLETMINGTNDMIWSVNSDFKLITANKAFIQSIEVYSGHVIKPGDSLIMKDVFSEEYLAFWEDLYKKALTGKSFKKEIYTPAFNTTSEFWSEISLNPIHTTDDNIAIICYSKNITERKLAENQLKLSEASLRETQQLARLGSWELNIISGKFSWSEELYNIFDVDKNTFIVTYDSYVELINKEDKEYVLQTSRHTRETGESFAIEYHITTRKGEARSIKEFGYTQTDSTGNVIRLFGTSQDITEQKKSEENNSFKAALLNTIGQAVLAIDLNGVIIFWNKAAEEMYGWKAEEAIGKNADSLIPSRQTKEQVAEIMDELLKGHSWSGEFTMQRKDGVTFPVFVTDAPIYDRQHNLSGFIGVSTDISDRKKAELALIDSNERYEYVTKATFDAIWDWNIVTNKVYWGEGHISLFGAIDNYNQTDVQIALKRIHPKDIGNVLFSASTALNGKDLNWSYEHRYCKSDGTYAFVSNKALILRDSNGKATRVIGAMQNITSKKELENLLNKANSLARIGGWELDLAKQTLYWSDITREIHEVSPELEINLETAITYYKEGESRQLIGQKVQAAIEKGTPFDLELQIITGEKNEKWIRAIGEAEFVDGRCVKLYGSFQDIDNRKRAELAVKELLTEKNTILESIGDAFFTVDKNWIVTYWNYQAEKLLQTSKIRALHHNLWELFSDSVDSVSYNKYHLAIDSNQVIHFEDYYATLNKWFEVSAYPSVHGLSVYFKDVTERKCSDFQLKELNKNLQKQAKELAVSNADLEQFAYVASHDLQEPLRMVTSFLTLLEKRYENVIDQKGKKYIHFAVDGATRMRRIILDLLEFSRVGRSEDIKEDVDLNEMVKEIKILFRNKIEENGAIIQSDNLPVIHTHSSTLRQIFQNLIGNALKYSKEEVPTRIEITSKDKITYWQFAIKDNGIGISPEYYEKIFIIFQRLHTNEKYAGTGMGLAVTKKIIENYGGTIWVESKEGEGSVFNFTLLKQH